jgi:1-acyl-sn-glycerol-3-phosphate acyltransferase
MAIRRTFWHKLWLLFSIFVVNGLVRLFARVEVQGRENVPFGGGVLIASNHCSALDVLLVPMAFLTHWPLVPLDFLVAPAKERFFRVPVVGTILRWWGAFPIRQNGRDRASLGRIVELMKTEKMMLFPEGTRSPDGGLQPGMRSAGWLIHQARPLVVPTAVFGTEKVWPRRARMPRPFGRVKVVFGKPLNLDRYYSQPQSGEVAQEIVDEVMAAIAHLKTVHRPAWDTSPPIRSAP